MASRKIDKYVRLAGVLFLLQLIAALISFGFIVEPILWEDDFLSNIASNANLMKVAVLCDLFCGASILGIAVILFPFLKKYSERIALWYVGLRASELVTLILNGILLLSIISISEQYAHTSNEGLAQLDLLAATLRQQREWTQLATIFVFCTGATMFYYLLYKTKLVPRFISIWGLIAIALLFTELVLLVMGNSPQMILMVPMGLNEIFLGIWLIVKGFQIENDNGQWK